MTSRVPLALAVTALIVLAGCAAPIGLNTDTPGGDDDTDGGADEPTDQPAGTEPPLTDATPTLDDEVDVDGEPLAVDPDRLFARVELLTGGDVEPNGVTVRDIDGAKAGRTTGIQRLLGVGEYRLNRSRPSGLTRPNGRVYFDPEGAAPWLVERRLVHEFVHVIQFRDDWVRGVTEYDVELTRDFAMAWRAVAEGGAVYLSDVYIRRYMDRGPLQSTLLARDYAAGEPPGTRLVLAPYVFGARYVRSQVDSPRELESFYERIPRTTEVILHNLTPGSEPPMDLDVDAETGATFDPARKTRAGELFLRVVLRAELSRQRAATAAAGWGTDAFLTFTTDGRDRQGLVWVTRWDTPEDAEEFAAAAAAYADRRTAASQASFRVVELPGSTVVLVAGDESFVTGASVSGGGGDVTVSVDAEPALRSAHVTAGGPSPTAG